MVNQRHSSIWRRTISDGRVLRRSSPSGMVPNRRCAVHLHLRCTLRSTPERAGACAGVRVWRRFLSSWMYWVLKPILSYSPPDPTRPTYADTEELSGDQIPLINLLSTRYAEVLSVKSSGSVGRVGVCAVSRPPEGFDTLESAYLMRLGVPQPATQPTCAQLTLALR